MKKGFFWTALLLALAFTVAFAPAPAGAASVKSVQSGTATMLVGTTGTTQTVNVTIAAVTTAKSVLFFNLKEESVDSGDGQVRGELTSATNVAFTRANDTSVSAVTIRWHVVEFEGGVSVQRNTASVTSTSNVAITAVDLTKSFVLTSCSVVAGDLTYGNDDFFRARLTTSTNLEIFHNTTAVKDCAWQVVQYEGASVQRNIGSLADTATSSGAIAITAVDTTKSFVHVTWKAAASGTGVNFLRATLTSTAVTIDRAVTATGATIDYAWEVVAFTDGTTVQAGNLAFSTSQTSLTAGLTSVDTTRSVAFLSAYQRGGSHAYTADDNVGPGWFTTTITNATTLTVERQIMGSVAANAAWFVAQFFKCAAVGDAGYVAANAQSTQATVYWSSSPNPVLILRKTAAFGTEKPDNGKSYAVGATGGELGTATVEDNDTVAKTSFTQTGLTNLTTYYYKVFPKTGSGGASCYSPGIEVNAKPQAAPPAWSYMMASGSMLKPGIAGDGTVYTSSNASRLISLGTATGTQSWTPVAANAAVQGWLTWIPVSGGAWYNANWNYRKKITIDATKVGGPLSNFPVLVSRTDADLQGKAQASGNDILFTAADGTTKLSHEIEKYASATGELIAWVKVPSLSSAANTDLYLYYGNAAATNQQDAANAWDANHKGVWHLKETTGGAGAIRDSTLNANHGTDSGTPTLGAAGKIGNAVSFPAGGTDELNMGTNTSLNFGAGDFTVSAWINPTDGLLDYQAIVAKALDTTPWTGWALQIPPTDNNVNMWIDQTDNAASSAVTISAWSHISWTRSGGTSRLFINGAQAPTTGTSTANVDVTTRPLLMGFTGGWNDYRGTLDEVRVSNLARSAAWILTDFNNQNSPSTFYAVAAEERGGTMVIGGDQSGRVYGVGAASGAKNWEVALTGADAVQAGISVQLRANSNAAFQAAYTTDVVFAATRNATIANCGTATTNNKVFALRASDGVVLWTFNGTCTDGSVDIISGQPWVDYGRNRLYVTSRAAGGAQSSLWVINTLNGALVASFALVDVDTSPTMSFTSGALYVGNTSGSLYAIDLNTLALKWSSPFVIGSAVNGFVWEDAATPGRLYMTTADGNVRCVQDNGTSASACTGWTNAVVAGASTPLLLGKLFVGSSDGRVHQINLTTGADEKQFPAAPGTLDGAFTLGDISTETGNEIFVGTNGGKIFKIDLVGGALP